MGGLVGGVLRGVSKLEGNLGVGVRVAQSLDSLEDDGEWVVWWWVVWCFKVGGVEEGDCVVGLSGCELRVASTLGYWRMSLCLRSVVVD